MERLHINDFDKDAVGFCFANSKQTTDLFNMRGHLAPLDQPCVVVTKQASLESMSSENIMLLQDTYDARKATPLFVDKHGNT